MQQIGKFVASGSYSRIIYCEGHLIVNGNKDKSRNISQ